MLHPLLLNLEAASAAASATTAVSTSGTVSQTQFTTQQILDHAFRRAKIPPQLISGENLQTAMEILYMQLSTLASRGIALWAVERQLLPVRTGYAANACPAGTLDILNVNLRYLAQTTVTASASTGTPTEITDGDPSTLFNLGVLGGTITLTPDSPSLLSCLGIMPGVTGEWTLTIEVTADGTEWVTAYTGTIAVTDGVWVWIDLDGVPAAQAARFSIDSGINFAVREVYWGGAPQEVPIAKISRDTYSNLPNKASQGRPSMFWYDRQRSSPELVLWPVPSDAFANYQLVVFRQRHVQDVGTMTQIIEVPQRWYLAIVNSLARELCISIPEADESRYQLMDMEARRTMSEAWDSETDSAPAKIVPNIRMYTR